MTFSCISTYAFPLYFASCACSYPVTVHPIHVRVCSYCSLDLVVSLLAISRAGFLLTSCSSQCTQRMKGEYKVKQNHGNRWCNGEISQENDRRFKQSLLTVDTGREEVCAFCVWRNRH